MCSINPTVSICIPAYHAERYLPETLKSVREQSFREWELIVIEDGSQDGTEEIVRQFAGEVSQNVTFQRHMQNRGLPATRLVESTMRECGWPYPWMPFAKRRKIPR